MTEEENSERLRELLPAEDVRVMPAALMRIPHGYKRQMAAKLHTAWRLTSDPQLVITDDDTEAIRPWGAETFFRDGRALLHYRVNPLHPWRESTEEVFVDKVFGGIRCVRQWQLRLPFAVHGESLARVSESAEGRRCLERWQADLWASEFDVIGEWLWRQQDERCLFRDVRKEPDHWTVGRRPSFRDYQRQRLSMRKRLMMSPIVPYD